MVCFRWFSFLFLFSGMPSQWISASANAAGVRKALLSIRQLKDVKVSFSLPYSTACQIHPNIISIEFSQDFGPQNPLVPQGLLLLSCLGLSYLIFSCSAAYLGDSSLITSGGSILVNANGFTSWTDFNGNTLKSIKGNKENDICANRGICNEDDGICECFNTNGDEYASSNGYGTVGSRGDCGYVLSSTLETGISTCPGIPQCSGHGVCDTSSFRCFCSSGWNGGDCSERSCPSGKSWFSYPSNDDVAHFNYGICSDMGLCDKSTGKCSCRPGFYGEACEYMACDPTGAEAGSSGTGKGACNGHGTCMNMAQLALWSNKNGDATDYTYGSDPNNPITWDSDKVHGCYCNEGFSGYDCSLKECVRGDDPGTYNDHVEVQLLQCIASSGNFSLSFRQHSTPILPYNINGIELRNVLASLPSIKALNVYFAYDGKPPNGTLDSILPDKVVGEGTPLWYNAKTGSIPFTYNVSHSYLVNSSFCDTTGNQVAIIEFTHTHGNLPEIQINNEFLMDNVHSTGEYGTGRIKVYSDGKELYGIKSIKGTTENDVCNNRGLCNYETGECECFSDWTSSDGSRQGGPGMTGDCGYRNDLKFSSFNSIGRPFSKELPFTSAQENPAN
jgi:hypothetical protein